MHSLLEKLLGEESGRKKLNFTLIAVTTPSPKEKKKAANICLCCLIVIYSAHTASLKASRL